MALFHRFSKSTSERRTFSPPPPRIFFRKFLWKIQIPMPAAVRRKPSFHPVHFLLAGLPACLPAYPATNYFIKLLFWQSEVFCSYLLHALLPVTTITALIIVYIRIYLWVCDMTLSQVLHEPWSQRGSVVDWLSDWLDPVSCLTFVVVVVIARRVQRSLVMYDARRLSSKCYLAYTEHSLLGIFSPQ